jgi:hypothetical protein
MEMAAAKPPEPPEHINLAAHYKPYWDAIVRNREYNSWTDAELEHVAELARCKYRIEKLTAQIDVEGDYQTLPNGAKKIHPAHQLLDITVKRTINLSRLLMVHALATVGEVQSIRKRNDKQREVQRMVDARKEEHDLLARPTH